MYKIFVYPDLSGGCKSIYLAFPDNKVALFITQIHELTVFKDVFITILPAPPKVLFTKITTQCISTSL